LSFVQNLSYVYSAFACCVRQVVKNVPTHTGAAFLTSTVFVGA